VNQSYSAQKGTLRGLHYQREPYQEAKLLRVLQGKIWDIALDIRKGSPTFGKYHGVYLEAGFTNPPKMFYIPPGCAHGFITLTDNVVVEYLCSSEYKTSHEGIIRWNDPLFAIDWPTEVTEISEKDLIAPDFQPIL
jgi:dTDP-4-dehydrorhamnose 3,5-epimerase